jgi:hypothetical protein
VLANWVETPNFAIEWGPSLTNEDGTRPVRDADLDGIPDVVELWAAFFEAAYGVETGTYGFGGGALATNLIPVYIGNSDPATTFEDLAAGTYAVTFDTTAAVPYIVVHNNFSFVPANGEGASVLAKIHGAMKIVAAHELLHVFQFAMPLPPSWVPSQDDWWLETTANWMEDEVFDGVNDYYQYFQQGLGQGGWADFVELGLPVATTDLHYVPRAYGGVIFAKYLSEHVGGAASIRQVFDLVALPPGPRILPALDQYAQQKGFSQGLNELYLGFAAANAVMDYREGTHYGAVPVRKQSLAAASSEPGLRLPRDLGATYLEKPAGSGAGMTVGLAGTPAPTWGLSVAVRRAGGYSVALGAVSAAGSPSIAVSSVGTADAVFAIPCFLQQIGSPTGYLTTETVGGPAAQPPGTVGGLVAAPRPGGLDVSWTAPTTGQAAGYVVRWGLTAGQPTDSRTLFGASITSLELRGLPGAQTYFLSVSAYDAGGNLGPPGTVAATTQPAVPVQTPTPAFQATSFNRPPVADAGPDALVAPGALVTLDGTRSADPDGTGAVLGFLWQQTAGPPVVLSDPSSASPTFQAPSGTATLTFRLTVTDDGGLSSTDAVSITASTGALPPVANAGADQTVPEGTRVTLDGSASFAPDGAGATLAYAWSQLSGPPVALSDATQARPSFTAPAVGAGGESLEFRLTVTDGGGLSGEAQVTVQVLDLNVSPVADAGADQHTAPGQAVLLDGSASTDPDGANTIAGYLWRQTSGTPVVLEGAETSGASFVAPAAGAAGEVLGFELTVTDQGGLQASDVVQVTMEAAAASGGGGGGCFVSAATSSARPGRAAPVGGGLAIGWGVLWGARWAARRRRTP